MSNELRDLISQAAIEVNPEMDNPEVDEELKVEPDYEVDEQSDTEEEVEEESDELDEDETSETDGKTFTVKVNGEEFNVSEKELKAGYQRQADYTRATQALKVEKEQLEEVKVKFNDQFTAIEELDSAWEENPVQVLTHFASNTENPTQAVAMLIRDLAAANVLDRDFLNMFGITPDVQAEWARDNELNSLRTQNQRGNSQKERQLEEAQMEIEVQRAIAVYDSQIDEIIEAEGYEFNTKQRTAFRQELAQYAAENELTNLKAAYKAFKYEESQNTKKLAAKTAERAKAKKNANAVTRSGSGEGSPVSDTSDLNAVIRAAMKESQA